MSASLRFWSLLPPCFSIDATRNQPAPSTFIEASSPAGVAPTSRSKVTASPLKLPSTQATAAVATAHMAKAAAHDSADNERSEIEFT